MGTSMNNNRGKIVAEEEGAVYKVYCAGQDCHVYEWGGESAKETWGQISYRGWARRKLSPRNVFWVCPRCDNELRAVWIPFDKAQLT